MRCQERGKLRWAIDDMFSACQEQPARSKHARTFGN
jgi:hypothetical protein